MAPNNTVCFTGQRPDKLGGYDENNPIMIKVKENLQSIIQRAINSGYHSFISGMAPGVDMIAAEIVLDLKKHFPQVRLIAAVPFEGQESTWPKQTQKRWSHICDQADEVHMVCEPGYQARKLQIRNQWMVDRSSVVVAIWDGWSSGGTYNCIEYARRVLHDPYIMWYNPSSNVTSRLANFSSPTYKQMRKT